MARNHPWRSLTGLATPGTVAAALLVCVVLWNAWVCDDAFITFRTSANVLAGSGPRWNVDERVQAYSNPLWLMLVLPLHAVLGDPVPAAIILSVGCTLAAMLVVARLAPSPAVAALGIGVCMVSKAFIDYSTSGLENPAATALLACLAASVAGMSRHDTPAPRRLLVIAATGGLLALNRLDGAILAVPLLLWVASRVRTGRSALALGGGLVPLVAWLVFATVYYGFPFPNTAYAKLDNGWDAASLARQGLRYLQDSAVRDPVTLATMAAAAALAACRPSLPRVLWLTGVGLHLAYVVKIGGDFMSGRFLTAPFFAALLSLVADPSDTDRDAARGGSWLTDRRTVLAGLLLLGLVNPGGPLVNPPWWRALGDAHTALAFAAIGPDGICDERAFYYPSTGLAGHLFAAPRPENPLVQRGVEAREQVHDEPAPADGRVACTQITLQCIGFAGFHAGPGVHIIDPLALSDAFLARLPPEEPRQRIGHIARAIPEEYVRSRLTGRNQFTDPDLGRLYDDIMLVTTGPLFTTKRWRAIVRLNTAGPRGRR